MATTTADDPELEGRMHVGDAAREVIAKLDRGTRRSLTGSPIGSLRRVSLLLIGGVAIAWPEPWLMAVVSVLIVLAYDAGQRR